MFYQAHEVQRALRSAGSSCAALGAEWLGDRRFAPGRLGWGRVPASLLDVFAHATAPRGKPAFAIRSVEVDGRRHPVSEATVLHRPFGDLKRFAHAGLPEDAPRLLIVAPMSGHYATLLRGTVARMLERCEVFVTDWADARTVPLSEGRFDLDDYIEYLIAFLEAVGPGTHVLAVCQPSVPALAATAVMAATGHPARPRTLTMMGGPVDTREAPTAVNRYATRMPHAWFRRNVIATVPARYPGAGRRVYPGFLQLASFMAMNLRSHLTRHYELFRHLVEGDAASAAATKAFYDEYRAVCDIPAEFYLQTIDVVFQRHALPRGEFVHRGAAVDLGLIRDTALLAIEGEDDDISGVGQTRAALTLTPGVADERKKYVLVPAVGHYGLFNGAKWREAIAPEIESWIAAHGPAGHRVST
ncbi:MAG: polyhydroxyalkanoate depolymerase [Novosphingobium sp.]